VGPDPLSKIPSILGSLGPFVLMNPPRLGLEDDPSSSPGNTPSGKAPPVVLLPEKGLPRPREELGKKAPVELEEIGDDPSKAWVLLPVKGPGPPEKGLSRSGPKDDGGSALLPEVLPVPSEKGKLSVFGFEFCDSDGSVLVVPELPLNGLMSMSPVSLSLSSSALALASDDDGPLGLVLEVVPGLRDPEGRKMEGSSDGPWFWASGVGLELGVCVLEEEEDDDDDEVVDVRGAPKAEDDTWGDDVAFNGGVCLI